MALRFDGGTLTKLRPWAPAGVLVALALFIAWAFAATTLSYTRHMGLPLDDSYIYLTYAKQFGRGQPFTYFPGGGYSAGATSILWPMILAPFWTLGARGHALVWVAFGLCSVLYAAVGVGIYRFVRTVSGATDHAAGIAAAAMALVVPAFAWCALSGMEVALAAALLVATLVLLAREQGGPSLLLLVCLAATALARPESLLLVGVIVLVRLITRRRIVWLAPLVPVALWFLANRVLAGHFVPNTAVVKSHFYQPGFSWAYWREAVVALTKQLAGVFVDGAKSPLVWPKLVLLLYVIGSVRLALWARREKRALVAVVAIAAPLVLIAAVIATSGQFAFQNYRYIAAALPLFFLPIGVALIPLAARRVWQGGAIALAIVFAIGARTRLVADMKLYAQGVVDTNAQVVAIGDYIHRKLPDARVLFHDAGAIAYYGDGAVLDMLGLVTDGIAEVALNGPGSRFEYLESLPPDQRPTHFAYYPSWLGTQELFADVLLHARVGRTIEPRRLTGEADMQIIVADWDHVHTAERPINDHQGWDIVDRIDVADLASERAHRWHGRLGRRHFADPTAKWSFVGRQTTGGLYIDGGRTIREGGETFTVTLDPLKPTRLVLRTGGERNFKYDDLIAKPVDVTIYTGRRKLASLTVAPPNGTFSELAFNLPPQSTQSRTLDITVDASGPYRVFHWFVLQPESR